MILQVRHSVFPFVGPCGQSLNLKASEVVVDRRGGLGSEATACRGALAVSHGSPSCRGGCPLRPSCGSTSVPCHRTLLPPRPTAGSTSSADPLVTLAIPRRSGLTSSAARAAGRPYLR